ncbi:hypothetical protein Poli38472_010158 [Pythium oligandrum]|uniref:Arrestin-like N-terminal domain-containing protein n=1 Tax=Pythium oligandrum TaxID=41045 RepID=A0A8K1C8F7_PYTOL|nr:hypothetical protein Poli38472_010158 [Pythium oligandrum]|eukprot:TMW58599.1 hypothetical protein Poli38472_010158 [Pythium oligandrum]
MGKLGEVLPLGDHGSLHVTLEQTTVQCGGSLTGAVHLNVTKPLDVKLLGVEIDGKERIQWEESSHDGIRKHIKEHTFLNETVTLVSSPSVTSSLTIEQGNYTHPFTFQVPTALTPTLAYKSWQVEGLESVHVYVEYSLTVKFALSGPLNTTVKWSVPFTVEPEAASGPAAVQSKGVSASTSQSVRSMGIINRGTCHVRMELDSEIQDATSPIQVRVIIENASKQSLKLVDLKLYEDAYITGTNEPHRSSRVVCARRFDRPSIKDEPMLKLSLPVLPNDLYQYQPILPTMATHFIPSLGYRVVVECSLASSSKTKVSAPIRIVRRPGLQPLAS